jgi:hypothetical protein
MVVGNAVPNSNSDTGLRRGQGGFRPVSSLDRQGYVGKYDGLRCLFPMTEVEFLFVPYSLLTIGTMKSTVNHRYRARDSFFFSPHSEEEIRLGVSFSLDWYALV